MTYYFHSIAIKAGFKDENDMAHKMYKEHKSAQKIGQILGKYADVHAICTYTINRFLKLQGVKQLGRGSRKNGLT